MSRRNNPVAAVAILAAFAILGSTYGCFPRDRRSWCDESGNLVIQDNGWDHNRYVIFRGPSRAGWVETERGCHRWWGGKRRAKPG